jgi:hypothetical protein
MARRWSARPSRVVRLAIARQQQQGTRQPFFDRVEQVVDQLLFDADIPREHPCEGVVRKVPLCADEGHHPLLLDYENASRGRCGRAPQAGGLTGQTARPEEISGAQRRDYHLPAGSGAPTVSRARVAGT